MAVRNIVAANGERMTIGEMLDDARAHLKGEQPDHDDSDAEISAEEFPAPEDSPTSDGDVSPGELVPPEAKGDWQEKHLNEIRELRQRVERRRLEVDSAKERMKNAKGAYDATVDELLRVIDRGPDPQQTLFDNNDPKSPDAAHPDETSGVHPGGEEWRNFPVVELDLPEKVRTSLIYAELETVGAIADFTSSGKDLTELKGIGEATAEKVRDALDKVWAKPATEVK